MGAAASDYIEPITSLVSCGDNKCKADLESICIEKRGKAEFLYVDELDRRDAMFLQNEQTHIAVSDDWMEYYSQGLVMERLSEQIRWLTPPPVHTILHSQHTKTQPAPKDLLGPGAQ